MRTMHTMNTLGELRKFLAENTDLADDVPLGMICAGPGGSHRDTVQFLQVEEGQLLFAACEEWSDCTPSQIDYVSVNLVGHNCTGESWAKLAVEVRKLTEMTGLLTLKRAMDRVSEEHPIVLERLLERHIAEQIKEHLERLGGIVKLVPFSE